MNATQWFRSLVGAALLSASCSSVPFPQHTPLDNEGTRQFLHQRLAASQSRVRWIERALLDVRGEEVVLTIYAESDSPQELRLAAVSDLGTTLFSAHYASGELNVMQATPSFPDELLERLVADHFVALLPPALDLVRLVRLEDGKTALHYRKFENEVLAFIGSEQGELMLERGEDGDWRATIQLRGEGAATHMAIETSDGSYTGQFELGPWQ